MIKPTGQATIPAASAAKTSTLFTKRGEHGSCVIISLFYWLFVITLSSIGLKKNIQLEVQVLW